MAIEHTSSLRRLLLVHEFALLTLVVVTGALAVGWGYLWQQSSAETIRLNELAHTAEEIRSLVFKQIQEVSTAALRENPRTGELYHSYLKTLRELFNELRRNSDRRAEDYAVQNMQTAFSLLESNLRATLEDPLALNRLVRAKLVDPAFERQFVADFERAFEAFSGLIDQQLESHQVASERRLDLAPWAVTVPIALGIALVLLSRRSLTQGFVRPMRTIMEGTRAIQDGHLDRALPLDGVAEMRELARSINHMAAELARSRHALLDHERQAALGGLIPVVAHNVRNPLAAIRANAQLLDGADSADEVREIRAAIIDTVDRLGRWITALVSYLHPLEPRRQTVGACDLVDAALRVLAPRVLEQAIVCARAPWDESATIEADRDLMEQALYGLLNNAIEASPHGAVLTVGVERRDDGVRITVSDAGGGIPFIPEPNELVPGPSTKRFGTGLGIPIAFKICQAHGYRLAFVPRPGEGTDVLIDIPPQQIQPVSDSLLD